VISLWMLPGDPDPHLYLIGPSGLLPQPTDKVTVELLSNGGTFQADGYVASSRDPVVVKILHLRHKFPAAFAQSNEVRVIARGKQILVPIPGAAKALKALRECIDMKLPEWGVDPKAYDALQVPPTDIENYEFMSSKDYPQDLLDANWMGDVIIRLDVDATGKVTNCAVVVTSGHKSVDDISCFRAMQRGRFNPAVGADGKPTAAVRVRDVVFRIAE
jgi:TonB family protein